MIDRKFPGRAKYEQRIVELGIKLDELSLNLGHWVVYAFAPEFYDGQGKEVADNDSVAARRLNDGETTHASRTIVIRNGNLVFYPRQLGDVASTEPEVTILPDYTRCYECEIGIYANVPDPFAPGNAALPRLVWWTGLIAYEIADEYLADTTADGLVPGAHDKLSRNSNTYLRTIGQSGDISA